MSVDSIARSPHTRKTFWLGDLRSVRIVRFGLGMTFAMAIAFGFDWPTQFLLPVLTVSLLGTKSPAPTVREGLAGFFCITVAFSLGVVFSLFALSYPLVYVPALGLVLFHIYYLLNRGGAAFFAVMLLVAVLLLPMMAQQVDALATGIAMGFAASAGLAIIIRWLAFAILPDPLDAPTSAKRSGGYQSEYSAPAARNALKSTIVVLPVATLFIAAHWTSQVLIIVFVAVYSVAPVLQVSKQASTVKVLANVGGGCAALLFYWLLVAVPEYYFLIALSLLSALLFGTMIYSDRPNAPLYATAFSTLIILVSTSMGAGAEFGAKFMIRVALIAAAGIYVVAALSVLEHFWPPRDPST